MADTRHDIAGLGIEGQQRQYSPGNLYKDARKYFYQALITTGAQKDRDALWGKLFQSIGKVIHHVQDMAQPQHVRNDQHVDKPIPGYFNPSAYESYTRANREGIKAFFSLPGPEPVYTGSNPGAFKTPRDFWKNSGGSGMAEFTNRNFVSAGTNFVLYQGQPVAGVTYASPMPAGPPQDVPVSQLSPPPSQDIVTYCGASQGPECTMSFYATNGPDVVNARASAFSIFDQYVHLRPVQNSNPIDYQTDRIPTLNRYTFDAAHATLLPKAVGYSAGLINLFSAARWKFRCPTKASTALSTMPSKTRRHQRLQEIKLKLKNVTPSGTGIEPMACRPPVNWSLSPSSIATPAINPTCWANTVRPASTGIPAHPG